MIAKGNTHGDGDRLARYMTEGVEGERAELWDLRGFATDDIREAFRSVHVMAEATRCEKPFFHAQVRLPDGEEITRDEWRRIADRIESKLGLTDQPRAISFHTYLDTGYEHMHIAWSRIDSETMTAKHLPYFKERLKEVSRELEIELELTRVSSERTGPVRAPLRNEFEEARRLGVDIQAVRQGIRDCFERSDNGRSFEAALAEQGWVLAQGDRRAFVVIDHEGGIHALGKRILGITSGETRERLADLDGNQLPGVDQARSFIREHEGGREKTKEEPMRDPHREEMAWQDALAKAAIEKEKVELRFIEPKPAAHPAPVKGESRPRPPELGRTSGEIRLAYSLTESAQAFADALEDRGLILATVSSGDLEKLALLEQRRAEEEKALHLAKLKYLDQRTAEAEKAGDPEGVAALKQRRDDLVQRELDAQPWMAREGGIANLSREQLDAARLNYAAWSHKDRYDFENYVSYTQEKWQRDAGERKSRSRFKTGDLVVVNEFGEVYGLTQGNTGDDYKARQEYLKNIDRRPLGSVIDAWATLKDLHEHRREEALWPEREKHWPVNAPAPRPIETSPRYWFNDVAWSTTLDKRPLDAPRELRGKFSAIFKDLPEAGHIWEAYHRNRHDPNVFAEALEQSGILLASTTKEEAEKSHRLGSFSKEIGHFSPIYREGEIVAVGPSARVYRLNDHTTGQDRPEIERFLKNLDRTRLQGIEATKENMHGRAEQREAFAQLQALINPVQPLPRSSRKGDEVIQAAIQKSGRLADKTLDLVGDVVKSPSLLQIKSPAGKTAARAVGKTLDLIGNVAESLFAPVLTPGQKREAAQTARERAADTADKLDLSQYRDHREQTRQRQEQEQETNRQRRETERER
jgi:hypothetical protein